MSANSLIDETKYKNMKGMALGIWYVQIPYNYLVDPYGNIIVPKKQIKNGKKYVYVWINRKQRFLSSIPKLNYKLAMDFKTIFV